jgi:hypothetical protein
MARIPGAEDFGNVVARPINYGQSQTPRGAFGSSVAAGITSAAGDVRAVLVREQAEAQAARAAADRARALTEMQTAADDLAALGDEFGEGVRTGSIDKTKAGEEWSTRAGERVSTALQNVPGEFRQVAERDLQSRVARLGRGVGKAVTARDQADTRAGIGSTLEAAERRYLTDPAGADELVRGTLENLGPASGLAPDQLTKLQQGYLESSRWNRALTLVNAAKRDNKALDGVEKLLAGDEFAALDPARRVQLSGQIEGFRVSNLQRAEVAARRAEAARESRLREAQGSFNAAQTLISQGKVLSPEYAERVAKETAGTPFAEAFRESLKAAVPAAAFGSQPIAVQAQALQALRAKLNKEGTNPDIEKRVGELQRIHDAAVKDYADDPLPAALERGILPELAPISTTSLEAVATTIGARIQQASLVQQQVGRPVSPLTRGESEAVAKIIGSLPVEQKAASLAQLAQLVGPQQAAALARQMAPKDQALGLALGLAGSRTTQGRYTSELVLRGAGRMADKSVSTTDGTGKAIRQRIIEQVEGVFSGPVREQIIDAAEMIHYGLDAAGSASGAERAVMLAVGGAIGEHNGRRIPMPAGVQPEDFASRVSKAAPTVAFQSTDGKVYMPGGQPMPVEQFVQAVPQAQLEPAGAGRYFIRAGSGLATNAKGAPLVLEVGP